MKKKENSEPKLTPEQYWKWKNSVEEMNHCETKLKNSRLMHALMEKDIELQKLKAELYKSQIRAMEQKHIESKKYYEEIKSDLEKSLNMSLNDCVIDDYDFSIKKL